VARDQFLAETIYSFKRFLRYLLPDSPSSYRKKPKNPENIYMTGLEIDLVACIVLHLSGEKHICANHMGDNTWKR
jgi:hypothetical protein